MQIRTPPFSFSFRCHSRAETVNLQWLNGLSVLRRLYSTSICGGEVVYKLKVPTLPRNASGNMVQRYMEDMLTPG